MNTPGATRLHGVSSTKLALLARQLRASEADFDVLAREPIAVVGMGLRFPGGGVDGESLWNLLCGGTDAVTEVPRDRWDVDAFYDPDPATPGKMNTRRAGFLRDGMDRFDADFFGISPREASRMDPQQRLLLEVGWEALEDAAQPPDLLAGTAVAVYIGVSTSQYGWLQMSDPLKIDAYAGTGNAYSIVANRLSYLLDLQGPSLAVDTGCSSSLVAVHLACQSLRNEECRVALAGGVSIILAPEISITLSQGRMLAPDGRCKVFDALADGYVRGEGCGVVVLKRLSDALADGDRVRAVIRGSAVNQDGRSNGLTAPSGPAQQRVVGQALAQAGISPGRVEYIEAHGTGTALGDPIEIEALDEVLGPATATTRPCAVGSIKANIGHLEAAAGIAGLIKTVLVLEHGEIPPQAHFHHLNPHIRLENSRIRIPTRQQVWPGGELPRIAGVSAFGFGGTNAHVVLEEAPPVPRASGQGRAGESLILPLSTRSPEALRELGRRYADRLRSLDEGELEGFCATAALRRSHHLEHRLAVTGETAMELAAQLELAAEQRSAAGLGSVSAAAVVFVFSGQGSQYAGMCGQLLDQEPVFRAAIEACEAALGPHAGELFARYGGLLDQLRSGEAESLERTELAQPLLFAVQFGLTALWRSWGIEPAAVLGHSLGEVAAACAAGALELDDAARIVALRGSLMQPLHGRGTMVALPLDHAEALAAIESCAGEVAIAALNGPRSTVLSGTVRALEALVARLPAGGPGARWLPVAYAFHGPEMAPIAQALEAGLAGLRPRTPTLPLISTVTAARVTGQEQLLGAHWAQGAAAPVRFAAGLASLAAQMPEETIYLEIGPRPVLRGALAACLSQGTAVLSSLDQGRNDRSALLHTAATLYQHRVPIRWNQILPHPLTPAPLPLYPWQQKSFWLKNHILPSDKPSPATLNPANHAEAPTGESRAESAGEVQADATLAGLLSSLDMLAARVLEIPEAGVSSNRPLTMLGIDSIVAVELKQLIQANLGADIPLVRFVDGSTLADIAALIASRPAESPQADAAIPRALLSIEVPLPASSAQREMWLLHIIDPASPGYNIPLAGTLQGPLDRGALTQSIKELVRRHAILRTNFRLEGQQLCQIIHAPAPIDSNSIAVESLGGKDLRTQCAERVAEAAKQPFDLANGPLFRVTLFCLGEEEHVLLLNMHHVISDGWSMGVVAAELKALYRAFARHQPSPLGETPLQFAEYVQSENTPERQREMTRQLDFWSRQLLGAPSAAKMPTDYPVPKTISARGARSSMTLPASLVHSMEAEVGRHGTTTFTLMLTALNILLYKYAGQEDIVIGTAMATRTVPEVQELVGCLINFVALRTRLSGTESVRELLSRVREVVLGAIANQDCPLDKVVERLAVKSAGPRNPLYNVALIFHNRELCETFQTVDLDDSLTATFREVPTDTSLLDLRFVVEELPEGIQMYCEYATDLFAEASIERFLRSYRKILEQMLSRPELPCSEFEVEETPTGQRFDSAKPTDALIGVLEGLSEAEIEAILAQASIKESRNGISGAEVAYDIAGPYRRPFPGKT